MTANAPQYEPQNLQGYENVGFDTKFEMINPNVEIKVEADTSETRGEFKNVPTLSEDEAKEALAIFVSSKCCYGTNPVKNLVFTDLQSSDTYRYVLETFTESRSTQWSTTPYLGQTLYNNGMPPPKPWEICCQPNSLFKNEEQCIEVPNTAYVKSCNRCNGAGNLVCTSCIGSGRRQCHSCNGSGHSPHNPPEGSHSDSNHHHHHHNHHNQHHHQSKGGYHTFNNESEHGHGSQCMNCNGSGTVLCNLCNSSGRIQCSHCSGAGKVKCFIELIVKFENHENDFIKKSEEIPDESLRHCQAHVTFSEQNQRVYAISHHKDPMINKASYDIISSHLNKFKYCRIIAQRHNVYIIPVTQCRYSFKNQGYSYQVYGLDRQVNAEDYPQKCLCGCSII